MEILRIYSWVTNLVAFFIGLFVFRKLNKTERIIFWFVVLGVLTELISKLIIIPRLRNSMPVGHFYLPVSFFILSLFYYQNLKSFLSPLIIKILVAVYLGFCFVNGSFIQSIFEFPNITGSVGALILIFFSIVLFHKIMVEAQIKKLSNEPIFWFNMGVLIYYSANFFFYALYNYSLKYSIEFIKYTINIFTVFNLLFYVLLSIGFLKTKLLRIGNKNKSYFS